MVQKIIDEIIENAPSTCPAFILRTLQVRPGGYGFGDTILGTRIPILRKLAAKYKNLALSEVNLLLQQSLHEARFMALVILIKQFKKQPKEVFDVYMSNLGFINNWDLIDISAHWIVGNYCFNTKNNEPIWNLASSDNLWHNRIAVISTWIFIKHEIFKPTLELCLKFLNHKHHLIHKACGWMLREISKKDPALILNFIQNNKVPSITKSYALERIRRNLDLPLKMVSSN